MDEAVKNFLRRARWLVKTATGQDTFHRRQVKKPVSFLGGRPNSRYGVWGVFLKSLTRGSVIYSVGVGDDISFDIDLINNCGVTIHAFDPTPASHEWLAHQKFPAEFILHKFAVGDRDGTTAFYAHANRDWISCSVLRTSHTVSDPIMVPVRRLTTLMQMLGHNHIDLLKLDIEGAEYEVIADLLESGVEVNQLLVEFHHRFDGLNHRLTRQAIRQLNNAGFRIFYISPNGEEYSFVRF